MKTKTRNLFKAFLGLIVCLGVLFTVLPVTPVSAAAKMTNKKAQKKLKKVIKNKFCKYTFVDIDKDKVDELIVFGYSGKFVDGVDKEKTLTVYKASGKKANAILTESIKGDFYSPELSFSLYYYDGASYITINEVHEGYSTHTTYKWNKGKYTEYARIEEEIQEEDTLYSIEDYYYSKADFEKQMANIFKEEISYEISLCSKKIANKYIKKLAKAEYERLKSYDYFEKTPIKTFYKDFDGDGMVDMYIKTGENSWKILYAAGGTYASSAFFVNSLSYTINENGDCFYEKSGAYVYDLIHGTALYCTGRWMADENLYIDITSDGESYIFLVNHIINDNEAEEWIYCADYLGEDEESWTATFSCLDGGILMTRTIDKATGEENYDVVYTDGTAEFYFPYGEGMTWNDLKDDLGTYKDKVFERVEED